MFRYVVWLGCALWLVACSGSRLQHDFDPWFDFASLKTYAWEEVAEEPGDEIAARRWRQAVEAELQAKGYQPEHAAPDFRVSMQRARRVVSGGSVGLGASLGVPIGSGGFISLGGGGSQPVPKIEVDVQLTIRSSYSGNTIWTAATRYTASAAGSSEEQDRQVRASVRKLLEDFPPGK